MGKSEGERKLTLGEKRKGISMIKTTHLTKYYGGLAAVSDLSFSMEEKGIYGFLGVNGAGKSTTLNMITGCLAASSGKAEICGFDIRLQPKAAKKKMGYLPEIPPVYFSKTPREYLRFVAEAKGVPRCEREKQIRDALEQTQITDYADCLCRTLSKGYRQRVGIAQALLGHPEVVILDEPTVGLDPQQKAVVRELIVSLRSSCMVLLSSHILSEIEAICDYILIMSNGRLAAFDTKENLIRNYANTVCIELDVDLPKERAEQKVRAAIPGETAVVTGLQADRSSIRIEAARGTEEQICRSLFYSFAESRSAITRMDVRKAHLEEIFLELTQAARQEALDENNLQK